MDIGSLTGEISIEDQFSGKLENIWTLVEHFAEGFAESLGTVGIVATAAVGAIGGITAAITSLGTKGADINDVSTTFDHFAASAGGAEAVLEGLRKGTHGVVDDFLLMKDASRVMSAGAKLNAEDFKLLGDAAFTLQNRGLGSTEEMLNLISTAMVTGRTRTLSMKLGIVDTADATQEYANKLGVAKDQLTQTQTAEVRRMAVMDMLKKAVVDAGDQQLDFGEKIDKVKVSISNWFDELASTVAESPMVTKALDDVVGAIERMGGGSSAAESIVNIIDRFSEGVSDAVPYVESFVHGVGSLVGLLSALKTPLEVVAVGIGIWTGLTIAQTAAQWALNVALGATAVSGQGITGLIGQFPKLFGEAAMGFSYYAEAAVGLVGPLGAVAIAGAAIFAAWEVGKTKPVSDFFQNAGLWFMGYSEAERAAMIEQSHLTDEMEKGTEAGKKAKPVVAELTEEQKAAALATEAAAAQHAAYEKSIQGVIDQVIKARQNVNLTSDAFTRLSGAQRMSMEGQEVLIPLLDKMVAQHKTLSTEQKNYYEMVTATRQNLQAEEEQILRNNEVTVDQIAGMKAAGMSMQEMAVALGTTVTALKAYETEAQTTERLDRQLADLKMQNWGHASDFVQMKNQEEYVDAMRKLDMTSVGYAHQAEVLRKIRDERTESELSSWSEIEKHSITAMEAQLAAAQLDYEKMVVSGDFHYDQMEKQRQKIYELQDAMHGYGDQAVDANNRAIAAEQRHNEQLEQTKKKAQEVAAAMRAMGGSFTYDLSTKEGVKQYRQMNPGMDIAWGDQDIINFILQGGNLEQLQKLGVIRMKGGPVGGNTAMAPPPPGQQSQGGAYGSTSYGSASAVAAQESGYTTPASGQSSSGAMSKGMGGGMVNTFNVNGTAEDVARKIGDILMHRVQMTRQFGSA